jgi:hypothetical protein
MEMTGARQAQSKVKPVNPSVLTGAEAHGMERSLPIPSASPDHKAVGYGLPCSNCRAYYPSDLNVCPICKSPERVSAGSVAAMPVAPIVASPESGPTRRRTERFLKELKSGFRVPHPDQRRRNLSPCSGAEPQRASGPPPFATPATATYVASDRLEAALHMDAGKPPNCLRRRMGDTSDRVRLT